MTREELMRLKGELTTQIEISQAKLQQVNTEIIKLLKEEQTQTPPSLTNGKIENDNSILSET